MKRLGGKICKRGKLFVWAWMQHIVIIVERSLVMLHPSFCICDELRLCRSRSKLCLLAKVDLYSEKKVKLTFVLWNHSSSFSNALNNFTVFSRSSNLKFHSKIIAAELPWFSHFNFKTFRLWKVSLEGIFPACWNFHSNCFFLQLALAWCEGGNSSEIICSKFSEAGSVIEFGCCF
jgi:hypothetical protein